MFLARKISKAKWDAQRNADRGLQAGEISADAVTGDLRTTQDTLSFWRCRTEEQQDIDDAALAIAAAGERIDRLDIIWLPGDQLGTDGQVLKDTKGRTPIPDLVDRHVDICFLDYVRLGRVARRVAAAVEGGRWRRLTKGYVRRLLASAIAQRRVELYKLADSLRAEIGS